HALSAAGFTLNVLSRQSSDAISANTIISQEPGPRSTAQKGAAINVVVSTGAPPANVPNVTNSGLQQAESSLQQAGLQSVVQYTVAQGAPVGSVIGQQPSGGASAPKGSTVTLMVAVPGVVPDVAGMSVAQARAKLAQAGYTVGSLSAEPQGQPGVVVSTDPAQDTELAPGQSVNLVVGASNTTQAP
ncbi:MAG: PASTA domain-containing protein, partial [bacterium]|nr:PASTA domain-containing protein [bacterium]